MPQKTTINDLPVEYEYASLTPDDIDRIKNDPTKEIYDYKFDDHEVLSADDIAAKVRFVYLEGVRMRKDDATVTVDDIKAAVKRADPTLEGFSKTHPRIFNIVSNPDSPDIDLQTISRMLEFKKQQEAGKSETTILAELEKMIIANADKKRDMMSS